MKYYKIRNWGKYQHYKDGKNLRAHHHWIKLYKNILSSHEWISMTDGGKTVLISLLLLSDHEGCVKYDASSLRVAAKLTHSRVEVHLKFLLKTGFIELIDSNDASSPRTILEEIRIEKTRKKQADLRPHLHETAR